jgi:formylglycine-generating enzyme required for sulfatase activity
MYTQVNRAILWLLRGDTFEMGGEVGDTMPVHAVDIGSFYISRGPISNIQFEAFEANFLRHHRSTGDDDPAVGLSFHQATAYANWYAKLSHKAFRLPTEAEWEFAARAMGVARYPWGEDPTAGGPFAWTSENSGEHCHPVDTPKPSKAGLFGMLGNVSEWTASAYRPYPTTAEDGRDDPSGTEERVVRGGSIDDSVHQLSCAARGHRPPGTTGELIGFRIVRAL